MKKLLDDQFALKFIVYTVLGEIYNDVEQTNDSVKSYQAALEEFSSLKQEDTHKFYQYLIVIYNNLGLSYLNRDENELGLGCLAKSCQIYESFKDAPGENVYHNRSFEPNGRPFRFFYEGGNDH